VNSRSTTTRLVRYCKRNLIQVLIDIAPYIANQRKALAETPAQEEFEIQLPPSTSLDQTVRIPSEMMPAEDQALHYFEYYFANIHPYYPVISKTYFYQQWQSARDSISPLLLDAIFACASLMLGDEAEGHKWLALASSQCTTIAIPQYFANAYHRT
jgi:hypothetical protein